MEIREATVDDTEKISFLLSEHFKKINNIFGFKRLKTNQDRFSQIIKERLEDSNDSPFKYFVLEEDKNLLGFINLMTTKEICEILVTVLYPEYNNFENNKKLVQYGIDFFKKLGVDRIVTEITRDDENLRKVFEEFSPKVINVHYEFNLNK